MTKPYNVEKFARAIETGNSVLIESLIDDGLVEVDVRLPRIYNPPALVFAVFFGHLAIAEILLRANARIDEVDNFGSTACHVAAVRSPHILPCLLTYQPNLALIDASGKTALQNALLSGSESAMLMLIKAGTSIDHATLCQISATSVTLLRALLDRGVDVRNIHGYLGTPLHRAAYSRFNATLAATLLYECKVDLEELDGSGRTCLQFAVELDNVAALEWFIQAGADVNREFYYGRLSSLHTVKDYDCAVALVAAGADVDKASTHGVTPIRRAKECRYWPVVHLLLGAGAADPDSDRIVAHQELSLRGFAFNAERIEQARRDISKKRLDFVRYRALQVCIGLQPLKLPALQTCEILLFSCGPVASVISFHH